MKNNYSDLLKDPRWQKKRLEIMDRDEFTCMHCGDSKSTLHVHHLKYTSEPWNIEDKYLITLCDNCHQQMHIYGNIDIVNRGVLNVYDFINLDPMLIKASVSYIENHKGEWIIQFRDNASPLQIIKVCYLLYEFIGFIDCVIKVRIKWPNTESDYSDVDIYEYLNHKTP